MADVRRALLDLTVGSAYATTVEVIGDARFRALGAAAAAGRDLRTALFLRRRRSAAEIGRLMHDVPLPEGESSESTWTAPAVDGFWGARYGIEQRLPDQWSDPPPAARTAGPSYWPS